MNNVLLYLAISYEGSLIHGKDSAVRSHNWRLQYFFPIKILCYSFCEKLVQILKETQQGRLHFFISERDKVKEGVTQNVLFITELSSVPKFEVMN